MKITIIGGGVGGLAAYLALRKHLPSDVILQLYEAYPSPKGLLGGGLGLAPNGQRVIAGLSPEGIKHILDHSFVAPAFVFRDEKGKILGKKEWDAKRYGFGQVMTARAIVHEALLIAVGENNDSVQWNKRVVSVKETVEGVEVQFEDGTKEMSDLIIGADGVRSLCREAIFGEDKYQPEYDGLTGIGGFLPISALDQAAQEALSHDRVTMTFSRSGMFGYSLMSAPSESTQLLQWWSTFEINPPPERDTLPSDIRAQLTKRHGSWKSLNDTKIFQQIIDGAVDSEHWLVLPRYSVERLSRWTSGRIILVGDAAHPVPPDSGQGVSCAVEDALTLALLLKHYNLDISKTSRAYEEIRIPRIKNILRYSNQSKDAKKEIGFIGEKIRNVMLWLFCHMPASFNDNFFAYDVEKEIEKYLER
ncbi:hypothetical protein C8J56DRAFT_887193 [Mycena floridula]|nr:hypothetical protein C8J56DRAFT_887193 [Mycena floridula]